MSSMRMDLVREELSEAMASVSASSKYDSDTRADSLSLGEKVDKGLRHCWGRKWAKG